MAEVWDHCGVSPELQRATVGKEVWSKGNFQTQTYKIQK